MKFTEVLCKRSLRYEWRKLRDRRLHFPDIPARIPQVLIEKGVEIVDPTEKPPRERWQPPVDDPRFYTHTKPEQYVNYNEEPAYLCTPSTRIYEGTKQVACLAKAKIIQGLPDSVKRLVGAVQIPHQNMLLQRYIMQAQYWNTTKEHLPKRTDLRKPGWKFQAQYGIPARTQSEILMRNMLRLCQSQVGSFPSLVDRRHIYRPYLNSHYYYRDKPAVIRGTSEWLVTSNKPLPQFVDEETVDASVNHAMPDLYPIAPTIDLHVEHNYTLDHDTGLKASFSHGIPHTLFQVEVNSWTQEQRLARSLAFCFGYAVAQARRQFGSVTTLPEPVCVQCVSLDHQNLNFTFMQLNTLAFDSDNGIKNFAWVDSGNDLYQKLLSQPWMPRAIRDQRLEDFDPLPFQKLLAVYLSGVPECVSKVA